MISINWSVLQWAVRKSFGQYLNSNANESVMFLNKKKKSKYFLNLRSVCILFDQK